MNNPNTPALEQRLIESIDRLDETSVGVYWQLLTGADTFGEMAPRLCEWLDVALAGRVDHLRDLRAFSAPPLGCEAWSNGEIAGALAAAMSLARASLTPLQEDTTRCLVELFGGEAAVRLVLTEATRCN